MRSEKFDIRPFGNYRIEKKVDGQTVSDLFTPDLTISEFTKGMQSFEVTEYEEGRIDLVLVGMYGDLSISYADLDIILYLNGIDNPLSIMKGDILMYPSIELFDDFRWIPTNEKVDMARRNRQLGKPTGQPNKSTRVDKNRSEYLDVAFPPTVNPTPRPGVRTEDGKIKIGGVG